MSTWQPLSPSRPHQLPLAVAYGATDIGPVRSSNEDNFLIDETLGLAMVADGMGGHEAGEVASAAALTALRDYLRLHGAPWLGASGGGGDGGDGGDGGHAASHQRADTAGIGYSLVASDPDATWSDPTMGAVGLVHDAIESANNSLYNDNVARDCADGGGMGTTLTGVWRPSTEAPLVLFQVGDSRLYRLRAGQLDQLTRDQTLYQQALDAGMIENLPARNLLLQAIGPSPLVAPEVRSVLLAPGDVLMLCSDGLHGSVPHGEIAAALADTSEATLAPVCARLIALAKEYGGRDNITVLVIVCL
jgi:serine/threonine protein phosphatase PrpC